MKIYTRAGDKGDTGLIGNRRVPKSHPRVVAYGDVDELCALLGVVRAAASDQALDALLHDVQRELFAIGAQLADPRAAIGSKRAKAALNYLTALGVDGQRLRVLSFGEERPAGSEDSANRGIAMGGDWWHPASYFRKADAPAPSQISRFWMVRVEGAGPPMVRHYSRESAITEAERLAKVAQKPAVVLESVAVIEPIVTVETVERVPGEPAPF